MNGKQIYIDLKQVKQKAKYLKDKDDNYDLSGQIAKQLTIHIISQGDKTLGCLPVAIYPLSVRIRHRTILTPIGYELLMNSNRTPRDQFSRAKQLLAPHGLHLVEGEPQQPSYLPPEERGVPAEHFDDDHIQF